VFGDGYRQAILQAASTLPRGSTLILAGHSLGGIEFQNAVEELKRMGFKVLYVVSFGSPMTAPAEQGTLYRYVKADGDPVAWGDRRVGGSSELVRLPGTMKPPFDPNGGSHHIYWQSETARQLDIFGARAAAGKQKQCIQLDLGTLREYPAAGLSDARRAPPPVNSYPGCPNCFWAAVAQDLRWAQPGQPYTAPPQGPARRPEIEATLRELYGPNAQDPLHGSGGLELHRQGKPVMSSREQIEAALRSAGCWSRGIVFVGRDENDANGHVFNARYICPGGPRTTVSKTGESLDRWNVVFWDASYTGDPNLRPSTEIQFSGMNAVAFYRTH
jgi:hypothetical protein